MLFHLTDLSSLGYSQTVAQVVELVDTQDLGSCAFGCVGSSPILGIFLVETKATQGTQAT